MRIFFEIQWRKTLFDEYFGIGGLGVQNVQILTLYRCDLCTDLESICESGGILGTLGLDKGLTVSG